MRVEFEIENLGQKLTIPVIKLNGETYMPYNLEQELRESQHRTLILLDLLEQTLEYLPKDHSHPPVREFLSHVRSTVQSLRGKKAQDESG